MPITDVQRAELLAFNDGKPFIVTQQDSSAGGADFSVLAFVRSVVTPTPAYIDSVSLTLSFPTAFPVVSPTVRLRQCRIFHPNFTDDGYWLGSELGNSESLSEYLMRLIRVLQYKEISIESIANRNAMAWYNTRKGSDIFPTDPRAYTVKTHISIHRINDNVQANNIQPIQIGAIHYE
jgi:hypothetical protein